MSKDMCACPPDFSNKISEISPKLLGHPDKGISAAKSVVCKYDQDYIVYSDGRLYSKKTNRFIKGKIDNVGYHVYRLQIVNPTTGKMGMMMYAHRLVAEHFIPNPENLPYVHHKDGNRLNNDVSNLVWVTAQQNTQYHKASRIAPSAIRYFEKNLEGEEWKVVKENEMYSVSSCGRVRNNRTNRLLKPDNSQKYVRVSFNDKKHYYLHRLVYCTFHDDYALDGFVIDHIDNNPKNNNLDNLQKKFQR